MSILKISPNEKSATEVILISCIYNFANQLRSDDK